VSDAHTKETAERVRALLARLDRADVSKLSGEDLLSCLVLRARMTRAVEEAGYTRFSIPITPYASPLRNVQRVFSDFPIRSAGDADRYLALLDQYPRFIGGIRRKLEDEAAAESSSEAGDRGRRAVHFVRNPRGERKPVLRRRRG
jgi:uncharacterized protein (DUF885 family)